MEVGVEAAAVVGGECPAGDRVLEAAGRHQVCRQHLPVKPSFDPAGRIVRELKRWVAELSQRFERDWVGLLLQPRPPLRPDRTLAHIAWRGGRFSWGLNGSGAPTPTPGGGSCGGSCRPAGGGDHWRGPGNFAQLWTATHTAASADDSARPHTRIRRAKCERRNDAAAPRAAAPPSPLNVAAPAAAGLSSCCERAALQTRNTAGRSQGLGRCQPSQRPWPSYRWEQVGVLGKCCTLVEQRVIERQGPIRPRGMQGARKRTSSCAAAGPPRSVRARPAARVAPSDVPVISPPVSRL